MTTSAIVKRRRAAPAAEVPASADNVVDAYARDVVEGRVPAGKYHRRSCERHLRDRAREGAADFPYRFDLARAERFFRFASKLKHYKGEWAGTPIALQPYQQFRLGSIFGWRHVLTGLRRFRTAYNEIPRKNGKSLEAAVVALYVTFFDGEPGAEGYTLATKFKQALIVFRDAKKLTTSSGLKDRIKINARALSRAESESTLAPLGANPEDGLNPHLIIIDEFHKLANRDLVDVMETATGARRQPLNFQITTAGDDPVSPCGDQHDYACKVLDGVFIDETFFAFIAHADDDDDWLDERTWRKANPNFGVSINPDDLRALATKARNMPSAAAQFKQKRLNIWINTDAPWLSLEGWRAGQTVWSLEDMRGRACWLGFDLASKIDLAAAAFAFPPANFRRKPAPAEDADGEPLEAEAPASSPAAAEPLEPWRFHVRQYTPADTVLERSRRDRAPYEQWIDAGHLITTPGNRIDQDVILDDVIATAKAFDLKVRIVGFDPWNAGTIEKDLENAGFVVVEVPQTFAHLSGPAKEFEADVLDAHVDTGGNPLLAWNAANAVVQRDGKDNIQPIKKRSRGRIDGIVASLIARKLAAGSDDFDGGDDFEEFEEGLVVI
jgi:phage terminase large subunit-like protein